MKFKRIVFYILCFGWVLILIVFNFNFSELTRDIISGFAVFFILVGMMFSVFIDHRYDKKVRDAEHKLMKQYDTYKKAIAKLEYYVYERVELEKTRYKQDEEQ